MASFVLIGGALRCPVREARPVPSFTGSSSGSGAAQEETTGKWSVMARLDETRLWQRQR